MSLYLEPAGEGDAAELQALEARCYTSPWTRRHFENALADAQSSRVLTLRSAEDRRAGRPAIIAYCVLQVVAEELHIHNLAVRPEERRRGLALFLLERALRLGARAGAETAFLEVRHSNWAALELYREAGFEAVSVRRDYYERPREDALLLRRGGLGATLKSPKALC